jgi:hypothetical protein
VQHVEIMNETENMQKARFLTFGIHPRKQEV